jgi:hypothetical protein
MSIFDKPISYERDVIMKYDKNNVDDEEYINQRENILKKDINEELNEKNNYNIIQNKYNPLFMPDAIIHHNIDTDKTYNINSTEYEPYLHWLHNKGLEKNVKIRYSIDNVNIDSLNRNQIPKNIQKILINLEKNPLTIYNYDLKIKVPENIIKNIVKGDKISLTGVDNLVKKYSAFDENGKLVVKFYKGKNYMEININPNIKSNGNLENYQKFFDTSKVFVSISGIKGVKKNTYFEINNSIPYDTTANNSYTKIEQIINDETSPYIGNIPISYINNTHRIYILPPDNNDVLFDVNKFYILLPFASDGTNIITNTSNQNDNNYTITFTFEHYNFIPLNEIIADYPVNFEHIKGFHLVKSINLNENYISVDIYPPIDINYKLTGNTFIYENFGGSSIYLNLIEKVEYAYPYQNEYSIKLDKTYNNVIQIKLVDSLFINFSKTFYNSGNGKNNRIYFQNIENIQEIQYIELDEGIYTKDKLKSEIEKKFLEKQRNINTINFGYDLKYNVFVQINDSNDEITFTSYKSKILEKPINNISPLINLNDTGIGDGTYTIVIEHPNHGISYSNEIGVFSGFIDHYGIPAESLNGIHKLKIIDNDKYSFVINNVNLNLNKRITDGGRNVTVFIPSPMKYLFNYPDTAGDVLGFRNVGEISSITKYNYIIKNSEPYQNELNYDINGNEKLIKNNSIKLIKFNYFMMECSILNKLVNSNTKNKFFTKFRITDDNIISNESSNTGIFLYDPIYVLDELSFKFYNPDNTLVDFRNIDHSFVLEITMIDNMPLLSNINTNYPLS